MWIAAGADLRDFHGKTCAECLPILNVAINTMVAQPAFFQAMDPANGWGDYDSTVERLRILADGMARSPLAVVEVSH